MTPEQQLETLTRGAVDVVSREELLEKLRRGKPLRIKYGADPSAPDLHLGHSVPLWRLRRFQDLGHTIVFIIGDFTGRIGDPSGRSRTRPMLSEEEVRANAATYAAQVGKILDISRCEIVYNSQWFSEMAADGLLRLAARYTVARMLERDDFAKRMGAEAPVAIVELLYPLIQAYDSVMVRADVEVGGTDQLFNMLVGRDIMRAYDMEPQVVMTWPLLVGTDGHEKMSKSLGNYIGVTDPPGEMFGKLMSIPDALLPQYLELLVEMPAEEIAQLQQDMAAGAVNPRDIKDEMARRIVALYHGEEAAQQASEEFRRVFSQRELPSDMPEIAVSAGDLVSGKIWLVRLTTVAGFAPSNSEARRLIRQGAVSINDQIITDENAEVEVRTGDVLRVGKRRFGRITVKPGD
ncbi:MAG: tyrosine--tRNA ligase [Armatimonadetes bacterium]|nr:tyrosine--tRNA ligase [Armatimonadota bacterium]